MGLAALGIPEDVGGAGGGLAELTVVAHELGRTLLPVPFFSSTVLGGQTVIGARSTIGGNVFLTQSVPPDSLVFYEEKQLQIVPKKSNLKHQTSNIP